MTRQKRVWDTYCLVFGQISNFLCRIREMTIWRVYDERTMRLGREKWLRLYDGGKGYVLPEWSKVVGNRTVKGIWSGHGDFDVRDDDCEYSVYESSMSLMDMPPPSDMVVSNFALT